MTNDHFAIVIIVALALFVAYGLSDADSFAEFLVFLLGALVLVFLCLLVVVGLKYLWVLL